MTFRRVRFISLFLCYKIKTIDSVFKVSALTENKRKTPFRNLDVAGASESDSDVPAYIFPALPTTFIPSQRLYNK